MPEDTTEEIKTPETAPQEEVASAQIPVVEQTNVTGVTLDNPSQSEYDKVRKKKEFLTYELWRRLPTTIRGQKEATLNLLGFDKGVIPLLRIKNQVQFAKKFNLSLDTLTDWNKIIDENPGGKDDRMAWAKGLTQNLIFALYKNGLAKGDADKVKLFLQYVEGWKPTEVAEIEDSRETTKLRHELKDILTQIAEPEGGDNASVEQTTDDGNSEASNIELANEDPQA